MRLKLQSAYVFIIWICYGEEGCYCSFIGDEGRGRVNDGLLPRNLYKPSLDGLVGKFGKGLSTFSSYDG